jgi:hypothetical protein
MIKYKGFFHFTGFVPSSDIDRATLPETSTEGFRIPVYMVTEESVEMVVPNRETKIKTSLVAVENPDQESSGSGHLLFVLGRNPLE